jgi:hypothetical protein
MLSLWISASQIARITGVVTGAQLTVFRILFVDTFVFKGTELNGLSLSLSLLSLVLRMKPRTSQMPVSF